MPSRRQCQTKPRENRKHPAHSNLDDDDLVHRRCVHCGTLGCSGAARRLAAFRRMRARTGGTGSRAGRQSVESTGPGSTAGECSQTSRAGVPWPIQRTAAAFGCTTAGSGGAPDGDSRPACRAAPPTLACRSFAATGYPTACDHDALRPGRLLGQQWEATEPGRPDSHRTARAVRHAGRGGDVPVRRTL
jgi:hypothetical protein